MATAAKKFIKVGTRVSFTRRNGEYTEGRVAGTDEGVNGRFVAVNTAEKGHNPKITKVRESELTLL